MNLYELLFKINEESVKIYSGKDSYIEKSKHNLFLTKCKDYLIEYLKNKYNNSRENNFVFSSLSYINNSLDKGSINLVQGRGNNRNGFYINDTFENNAKLINIFDDFMNQLEEGTTISLTKLLLNKKSRGGLILSKNGIIRKTNYPKNFHLDVSTKTGFNFTDNFEDDANSYLKLKTTDISTFFKKNGLEDNQDLLPYSRYLLKYLDISKIITPDKKDNFNIYFIKPSIIDFKHNLLLSIGLKGTINKADLSLITLLMDRIVSQTEVERGVELKNKSIKNAISTVMSRNMSHNIGSHVLSRVVDIESVSSSQLLADEQYKSKFDNVDIKDLTNNEVEKKLDFIELKNRSEIIKKVVKENVLQQFTNKRITCFNAYLRTRQDFLADIVSSTPQIQNTKFLVKNVLLELDHNRILLNRISGIDNFEFSIKTDIKINGKEIKDITIAISNDIIGQHAFYVIIENIIRNTAKHSNNFNNEKDHIVFTIRLRESQLDSSLYQITIFDNIDYMESNYVELNETDAAYKKYYQQWSNRDSETGRNKIKFIDKLITDQNIRINQKILNDEYELRPEALGLIEMEACTAYLRKIEIEKIESVNFDLEFNKERKDELAKEIEKHKKPHRLLRAINPKQDPEDENSKRLNVLGYRFYIPKPKKLLILDFSGECFEILKNKNPEKILEQLKNLESCGVLLLDASGFSKIAKYIFDTAKVYPHEQMLIWSGENDLMKLNDSLYLSYLPKRSIYKKTFINHFKIFNKENFHLDKFLDKPTSFNTEVLRAIVRNRAELKSIKSPHYREISLKGNDYYITDYHHGLSSYDPNEYSSDYYFDFNESKHKPYVNSYTKHNKEFNINSHLKFLDTTINNILILDERIQEQVYFKYGNKTYRDFWRYSNVFIPTKEEINLLAKNYAITTDSESCYVCKIKKYIKDNFINIQYKCKGLDYLVIHLGVIDKILTSKNLDKNLNKNRINLINQIIESIDKKPHIVLTSGRAPRNLPTIYSFITFSSASNFLIENRLKYFLNEVLSTSRPKTPSYEKDNLFN